LVGQNPRPELASRAKGLLPVPGRRHVKLSAFTIVDQFPTPEGHGRDRYAEVVALAEHAEAAGLSGLWVAEHHFQPGGTCPSPPVLLAACAARTTRLRLGVMVSVLPFHRPVDLAEEYALLDQLSHGRVNLGVGSGYIPVEFEGFGVDPASKRDRFDRSLEWLVEAFAGREVRTSDEPGSAPVTLNVRPVQEPHPPLWIAVQRREAIPFVARRNGSIALIPYATVSGVPELADEIGEFRAAQPPRSPAEVAVGLHLYAGDHPDRARAALDRFLASRLKTQSTFYQQKAAHDPHQAGRAGLEAAGFALIGSPREVADRLGEFRRIGVDEVLGIFDFGGLAADDVAQSVRALGREFRP
jgi:alkanesulfonate monooxygenase SsuD/methylene tetrahydromethanopterin reductase-like flavin-dependent oxidoreductase (luciferase family)